MFWLVGDSGLCDNAEFLTYPFLVVVGSLHGFVYQGDKLVKENLFVD